MTNGFKHGTVNAKHARENMDFAQLIKDFKENNSTQSPIWIWSSKQKDDFSTCHICEAKIAVKNSSTTNLIAHLKRYHWLIWPFLGCHYKLIRIFLFLLLYHVIPQQIELESHALSQFEDNSKGFLTVATKNRIEKNWPRFFEKSN